jgi:hypothetical protein
MKKINTIGKIFILTLIIGIIFTVSAFTTGDVNTGVKITESKYKSIPSDLIKSINQQSFKTVSPFKLSNKDNSKALTEFAKSASFFTLDKKALSDIIRNNDKNIKLFLPINGNNNLEFDLTQVNIFASGFRMKSMSGETFNFKPGLYYEGIIKGDNNSFVSASFFDDFVMLMASNNDGNYVLGSIKDNKNKLTEDYIFYNDNNLIVKNNFKCAVDDGKMYKGSVFKHSSTAGKDVLTHDSIKISFVADYQMYLDNGSSYTTLAAFVTGVFANVRILYQREEIPVLLSELRTYTSPDPYWNYSDSYQILLNFGANTQDNFHGDLAHLLSTGHNQVLGGIAWINVLCQSFNPGDSSGRFGFSNIENNYSPFPTYSWTVSVVTHELGHNIGSRHTHACVWPVLPFGQIGAIDSCYYAEGGCFTGRYPIQNGTIMSYCHLGGSISFVNGFGPLPGDTIRYTYSLAHCLDSALNSSEIPLAFNLLQNYPNPFNPSTTIKFALPSEGFVTLVVYDITGREVAKLLNNKYYNAGIFTTAMDAGLYKLASGIYLYRLDVINGNKNIYSQIKKMVLIK